MDEEKEGYHLEYPAAYPPLPQGFVKEEETSGDNNDEQLMMYPRAYVAIPRELIKEERTIGDDQEECTGQGQQLMNYSAIQNETFNEESTEQSKENQNAFNLEEQQPTIMYPPIPRGTIKEELVEEEGCDEQAQQVIAYKPIPRGRVKEESQSGSDNQDGFSLEEHQLDMEPIVAYPSIPRGAIKEELLEEEGRYEQAQQLIAYQPIPRGEVKEESQSGDYQDEFNVEEQQLIPQEGGNRNIVGVSTSPPIFQSETGTEEEQQKSTKGGKRSETREHSSPDEVDSLSSDHNDEYFSNGQKLVAYAPIPRGSVKEEFQQSKEDENDFNLERQQEGTLESINESNFVGAPVACLINDSLTAEQERDDEQDQQLISYPPIPRGEIKVESQSSDNQEELNLEEHKLVSQEEGNENVGNESISAPINSGIADISTAGLGNGPQRRKSQKGKKIIGSTGGTPSSTRCDDKSAETLSTIGSQTRRGLHHLKRGSTSAARDDDGGKIDISTTGTVGLGGHKPAQMVSTIRSRTLRSEHSKRGSTSLLKDGDGKTSRKRKVSEEETALEKEPQQSTSKRDTRTKTSKHSSLENVASSPLQAYTELPMCPFTCDKCKKTYKIKDSLVRHLRSECGVDPAFPCSECNYKAKHKCNLRNHLIRIHKVDRSQLDNFGALVALNVRPVLHFQCDKCKRTYKTNESLNIHKRVCGLDPSFSCAHCEFRAVQKYSLRRHLINVHNVERTQLANFGAAANVVRPQLPFKCHKCERSYKNKKHLNSHLTYECGVTRSFLCNQCGYRASQNTHLKRHVNAVHGASSSSL